MGGTLIAMHAAQRDSRIASFLALAAPVHLWPQRSAFFVEREVR